MPVRCWEMRAQLHSNDCHAHEEVEVKWGAESVLTEVTGKEGLVRGLLAS